MVTVIWLTVLIDGFKIRLLILNKCEKSFLQTRRCFIETSRGLYSVSTYIDQERYSIFISKFNRY